MKTTIKLLLVSIISVTTLLTISCDDKTHEAEKDKNTSSIMVSTPAPVDDNYKGASGNNRSVRGNLSGAFNFMATDANSSVSNNTPGNNFISSSAAVEDKKDTTRKFIRTAEMKFRVKSVLQATYSIEEIAKQFEGFVTYTNLSSTVDRKTVTPVSADSSLETIYYTVVNDMTLRVPNTKLDTTLKTISVLIDYLDYRTIRAEDVALQMLVNRLAQDRAAKSGKRIEVLMTDKTSKLKDATSAEELLGQRLEQADASKIANLELMDKINFSTITLNIYQRQTMKRELIANDKNIDAYRPGFGTQIVYALKWGWHVLEEVIIFISRLWGLILLVVVAYVLYRVLLRKIKP